MITGSMFGASMIGGSMISGSMLPGGQTRSFEGYPLLVDVPSSRKASRYTIFGNTNADAVGVGDQIPQLFSPITRSLLSRGIDISVSGNSVSFSGTRSESGEIVVKLGSVAAGHKLVFCSRNVGNCNIQLFASGRNPVYIDAANSVAVSPFDMDYYFQVGRGDSEGAAYNEHGAICVFDVTGTPYEDVTTADDFAHRLGYADAEHLPAFPYGSSFVAPIRVGSRNLLPDGSMALGSVGWNTGDPITYTAVSDRNRTTLVPAKAGKRYIATAEDATFDGTSALAFYDANLILLNSPNYYRYAILAPENTKYVLASFRVPSGHILSNVMVEEDTTAHAYEPYFAPTLYPSVLSSPLHKIGDIVDYKESNGKEHHAFGVVDLGTLTWRIYDANRHLFRSAQVPGIAPYLNSGLVPNVAVSGYTPISQNSSWSVDKIISCSTTGGELYMSNHAISSVEDFVASLQGVMLVYELATPTEVQGEPLPRLAIPKGESIVTLDTAVEPSNITAKI